jgi:hypothetical protein
VGSKLVLEQLGKRTAQAIDRPVFHRVNDMLQGATIQSNGACLSKGGRLGKTPLTSVQRAGNAFGWSGKGLSTLIA